MSTECLIRLTGRAIRNVYLTVTGSAAYQQTRFIARVLQEAHVSHRTIVHG